MIRSKLFRKHFAIASITVLAFAFVGALASVAFMRKLGVRPEPQPPIFFARLIEELNSRDAVEGLKKMDSLGEAGRPPFRFLVIDGDKKVLYGQGDLPRGLTGLPLPAGLHEGVNWREPPEGGRPPPHWSSSVIRLGYPEPRFLVLVPDPRRGPAPPPSFMRLFSPAFFTLVFTVLAGIAMALFLIFRSLREHVRVADEVIGELQAGNLKARFPIRSGDEIGSAMARFNRMAEEIEQLVLRLQAAEASRNFLLQELTHDLRTPVAALRSLLDTIFAEAQMKDPIKELTDLAGKEIEYISRLVEDLLLLSQVSEPKYKPATRPLDILELLQEEGEALALRRGGEVSFSWDSDLQEALVVGDEHLLRRLARNALENAFSFAKGEVRAKAIHEAGQLVVTIRDDGPGFDADALARFGERRMQRAINKNHGGRLSLGLGSVIMKAVVTLHRGHLQVKNLAGGGAEIRFSLPLSGI